MFPSSILDKKIEFWKKEYIKDSYGVPKETETKVAEIWANMYVRGGNLSNTEHSTYPSHNVEWKMRYINNIDYTLYIKHNNNRYKIEFIEELGRKQGLRIETSVIKWNDNNG